MGLEGNKTLLDLANETDDAKFKEGFSKLSDEDKAKVTTHLTEEATKAKTALAALNEEAKRKKEQAEQAARDAANNEANQNKSFEERLRIENQGKAFDQVFAEVGITKDEDKQAIRDQFKKVDDGSVTVDNIIRSVKKAVVAAKPEVFIDALKQAETLKQQADEFQRSSAGNEGGNTRDEDKGKQYSEAARKMVADEARRGRKLSLEDAENFVTKGATRIIR